MAQTTAGRVEGMMEYFANIEFAKPIYLWLLLALPLLWLRYRDRRLAVLLVRTLLLLLLVVTLADPQTTREQSIHEERVFAYDLSQSMPRSMRGWIKSATEKLAPGQNDRILIFGAEAVQASGFNEVLNPSTAQSVIQPEKTNLENL
ncbi:MAG TPA: hypothetical protein VLA17_10315, partial [Candidatus Limnocylindria bacterium]|nr:hypothetical protein [Candidatus Limnocylindria bacterium]